MLAGALDLPLVGDPERMIRERYARFAERDDVPFGEAPRPSARAQPRRARRSRAPRRPSRARASSSAAARPRSSRRPGHSPGHVAAWIPDAGLLAAGDAVMGTGIPTRDGTLLIPPMYAPPAAYRRDDRARALAARAHPRERPRADPATARRSGRSSTRAARRASAWPGSSPPRSDETPRTLLELCARVHAAYGGLPGRARAPTSR